MEYSGEDFLGVEAARGGLSWVTHYKKEKHISRELSWPLYNYQGTTIQGGSFQNEFKTRTNVWVINTLVRWEKLQQQIRWASQWGRMGLSLNLG